MRRLYYRKEALVAEGADPGIAEIRELFPDQLEIVEHVIGRATWATRRRRYWGGLATLASSTRWSTPSVVVAPDACRLMRDPAAHRGARQRHLDPSDGSPAFTKRR